MSTLKVSTLKERRASVGLTQVQVAERTGLTERGYQRYEAGERTPNARTAIKIAKALNSSVEELWSN